MGEGARRDTRRRLTVAQAADQLGVSVDAVRARIKRGTIAHERQGGRVYVLLDTDQHTDQERAQDHTQELIATLREQLQAERQAHAEARRLLAAALERIPPQIEAGAPPEPREAPESRGPTPTPTEAAGAPPGAREYAVTEQQEGAEPRPADREAQEPRESPEMHMPEVGGGPLPHDQQRPSERKSWWRRIFEG